MAFIHEISEWPHLKWDDAKLSPMLADVRHRQGRLLGRMEGLGFQLRSEASLTTLTADVVKSSAIEGEKLDARPCGHQSHGGLVLMSGVLPPPAATSKALLR